MPKSNVVLIGMPGAGKSSAGVILAARLDLRFHDTDEGLVARHMEPLQRLIDRVGLDAFQRLEEEYVLGLNFKGSVIATGGSVVYSPAAMRALKADGIVAYIRVSYEELKERLTDVDTRGIVMEPLEDLEGLLKERTPLYEKYADVTVDADGLDAELVAAEITGILNSHPDWDQTDAPI